MFDKISCRVGIPVDVEHDGVIDVCPCCGSPFDNQLIPLCENHNKLDFLGPGFPLFYEFLIFCIICILLLFFIQGIYGLATNANGNACHLANVNKNAVSCSENGINRYSWFNKEERDDIQSILNLFSTFALLIVLNIFKCRHKAVEMKLDNDILSPSDYTLQVSELPVKEKEEDIQNFFETCIPNRTIKISKIVMAYFVEDYVNLKTRKDELISKQSNLMSNIVHTEKKKNQIQPILRKKKEDVDKELVVIQEKIDEFEKECREDAADKFCGVVFISLQREDDQDAFLKFWQRSFFQTILLLIMSKLLKNHPKTYKGKIITVARAPEPTDVIWQNLGYTSLYRFKAYFKTNLATAFALMACGGAVFGINLAQVTIHNENKSNQEIVHFFGILAAVFLSVVNILLEIVVKKLVKYQIKMFISINLNLFSLEKMDNYTDFNISLTEKLAMAQFLNTAIIIFVANYVVSGDDIYGDGNFTLKNDF